MASINGTSKKSAADPNKYLQIVIQLISSICLLYRIKGKRKKTNKIHRYNMKITWKKYWIMHISKSSLKKKHLTNYIKQNLTFHTENQSTCTWSHTMQKACIYLWWFWIPFYLCSFWWESCFTLSRMNFLLSMTKW